MTNPEIPYFIEDDGAVSFDAKTYVLQAKGMWIVTNQADGAPQAPDDNSQGELRLLVEVYALRSRELSDAVAHLGALLVTGKPFGSAIRTIRLRRVLCDGAADDLFAFLSPVEGRRSACAPTGGEMPQGTPTAE